ncbi:hypothetical protein OPIT5_16975 [Opitutaceae bacterium TAV5]|nr:hypothetical protein OPIT5_16975 [Opitutaceae bacterium TAV5]
MKTKLAILLLAAAACIGTPATASARDIIIPADSLPQAARNFIATHFPGAAIFRAERDDDSYDVYLNNNIEIEFTLAGEWDNIDGNGRALPDSVIPAGILAYVRANYPSAFVVEIDRERSGYEIELSDRRELKFDKNGAPSGKPGSGGSGGKPGTPVPSAPVISTDDALTLNVGSMVGPGHIPLSVSSEAIAAGARFHAKGLPKGLKLDPHTGQITGQVTAKPGLYTVSFWTKQRSVKSAESRLVIAVNPFPVALTGTREVLIESAATSVPVGKLVLTVNAKGSWTGKLTRDRKTHSIRGTFASVAGDDSASNPLPLVIRRSRMAPLVIEAGDLGIDSDGEISVVVHDGSDIASGDDSLVVSSVRTWTGSYTPSLVLVPDGTEAGPDPLASTRVKISVKNRLTLKSTLPDGARVSASASGSATGRYAVFVNPYKAEGGCLAGNLQLAADLPRFDPDVNELVWQRPAAQKDKYAPQGGEAWTREVALAD